MPLLDEKNAHAIHDIPDVGMQASGEHVAVTPRVIVVMGGLAMPLMPVTKEQVRDLAARHTGAKVVGVCFQSMFERAGWMGTVPFDLMINAMVEPVTVTRPGSLITSSLVPASDGNPYPVFGKGRIDSWRGEPGFLPGRYLFSPFRANRYSWLLLSTA